VFSPPLKKSIVFLKYALKMDLVKGEWFDLYGQKMTAIKNYKNLHTLLDKLSHSDNH